MAAKKHIDTWAIVANGQQIEIVAGHVLIVDGALILETAAKGGHLIQAFAAGSWSTVALKEEADAKAT